MYKNVTSITNHAEDYPGKLSYHGNDPPSSAKTGVQSLKINLEV